MPGFIIVGYVWQILGGGGAFWPPLIHEQLRKSPSWIGLNNETAINMIKIFIEQGKGISIPIFDFSTLQTMTSHSKLFKVLYKLPDFWFDGRSHKCISANRFCANWNWISKPKKNLNKNVMHSKYIQNDKTSRYQNRMKQCGRKIYGWSFQIFRSFSAAGLNFLKKILQRIILDWNV